MLRSLSVATALALLTVGAAPAQQLVIEQRPGMPSSVRGTEVRIGVNMSFFVPALMSDAEAAAKAQENARRVLYESAGRECDVLKGTIASECRIEAINVNMNRNNPGYPGSNQPEGFNVNGNFAYKVIMK